MPTSYTAAPVGLLDHRQVAASAGGYRPATASGIPAAARPEAIDGEPCPVRDLAERTNPAAPSVAECPAGVGHNTTGGSLRIEARFFNSLARYSGSDSLIRKVELPAGASVGDLIALLKLPIPEIFLVLRNGRDITPGLYQGGVVNTHVVLDDGDVVAFSGPVPYSWAYGAPVV